jgi:hypothetical protein
VAAARIETAMDVIQRRIVSSSPALPIVRREAR